VFGIIKQAIGFRRFLLRGKEKVRLEWGPMTTSYNLKRLFNLGVQIKRTMTAAKLHGREKTATVGSWRPSRSGRPVERPANRSRLANLPISVMPWVDQAFGF
jgi:hypothetical protein